MVCCPLEGALKVSTRERMGSSDAPHERHGPEGGWADLRHLDVHPFHGRLQQIETRLSAQLRRLHFLLAGRQLCVVGHPRGRVEQIEQRQACTRLPRPVGGHRSALISRCTISGCRINDSGLESPECVHEESATVVTVRAKGGADAVEKEHARCIERPRALCQEQLCQTGWRRGGCDA